MSAVALVVRDTVLLPLPVKVPLLVKSFSRVMVPEVGARVAEVPIVKLFFTVYEVLAVSVAESATVKL